MTQAHYLCFVCLGATDVSLTVCNSAPRSLPGHAHLLPEVQWSHWHTNCWRDSSVCMFSSFPWVILRRNAAHAPHLICVRTLRLIVSTSKASAWSCFFPPLFFSALTHNVCSNLSAPAMAAGVSILSDLSYSMSGARSGVVSREMETGRRDDLIYIVLISLHYINHTNKQQRTARWKLFDEQDIFSWISC